VRSRKFAVLGLLSAILGDFKEQVIVCARCNVPASTRLEISAVRTTSCTCHHVRHPCVDSAPLMETLKQHTPAHLPGNLGLWFTGPLSGENQHSYGVILGITCQHVQWDMPMRILVLLAASHSLVKREDHCLSLARDDGTIHGAPGSEHAIQSSRSMYRHA
jgi:hypothetical protein